MLLGFVSHAACIYTVQANWVITDPRRLAVFDWVESGIHLFRMPAFFIISGFFSRLLIEKRGGRSFLQDRLVRLLVPFVAAGLVFNTAQEWLVTWSGQVTPEEYARRGLWIAHLWFLRCLIIYTVAVAACWLVLRRTSRVALPFLGGSVLLLAPLWDCFAAVIERAGESVHAFPSWVTAGDLLYYLGFFVFGFTYQPARDDDRLRRLAGWSAALLSVGLLGQVAVASGGVNSWTARAYFRGACTWSVSLLCLYLGRRLLNRPSASLRRLSDDSYSMYLSHHLFVIALGLAVLPLSVGPVVKFLVVVAGSFGLALGFASLVRSSRVLTFLFNGKWRTRGNQSAVMSQQVIPGPGPS
jgi:glucan biosynthesis protein C